MSMGWFCIFNLTWVYVFCSSILSQWQIQYIFWVYALISIKNHLIFEMFIMNYRHYYWIQQIILYNVNNRFHRQLYIVLFVGTDVVTQGKRLEHFNIASQSSKYLLHINICLFMHVNQFLGSNIQDSFEKYIFNFCLKVEPKLVFCLKKLQKTVCEAYESV